MIKVPAVFFKKVKIPAEYVKSILCFLFCNFESLLKLKIFFRKMIDTIYIITVRHKQSSIKKEVL